MENIKKTRKSKQKTIIVEKDIVDVDKVLRALKLCNNVLEIPANNSLHE